jgi:HlyD family secretion protein
MAVHPLKPAQDEPAGDDVVLSPMDRRIVPKRFTPQRAVVAIVVLAAIAGLTFIYMEFGLSRSLTVDAERLTLSRVSYGTFHEYIPVTGNVVPRTTIFLDAVVGGQVTAVHVEEGEFVTAGQVLVDLKNSNLQLQVVGTEAQVTEQLHNLSSTTLQFEQNRLRNQRELLDIEYKIGNLERLLPRRREILAAGDVSEELVEDLEAELEYWRGVLIAQQEAQAVDERFQTSQISRLNEALEVMNRNLSITRENLQDLTVTAPIDGQLTLLEANVGESKGAGARIGQVDAVDQFKVTALVDEFYIARITRGQLASVEIAGRDYNLEVTTVYPGVQDRQFEIDLLFTGETPVGIRLSDVSAYGTDIALV